MKGNQGSSGVDPGQPFVRDDVKLHDGLMRDAVEFGHLEKTDIIRSSFVPHQVIDIPARRRSAPGCVLRGNHDIETASQPDEMLTSLEPFGGVQKRASSDSQRLLCLVCREDYAPL